MYDVVSDGLLGVSGSPRYRVMPIREDADDGLGSPASAASGPGKLAKAKNKIKGMTKGLFESESEERPNAPLEEDHRDFAGTGRPLMMHSNSSTLSHVSAKSSHSLKSFTGRRKDGLLAVKGPTKKGRGVSPAREAATTDVNSIGTPTLISGSGLGIQMKLHSLPKSAGMGAYEDVQSPGAMSMLSDYFPKDSKNREQSRLVPTESYAQDHDDVHDQGHTPLADKADSSLFRQDFQFQRKDAGNISTPAASETQWQRGDLEQRFQWKEDDPPEATSRPQKNMEFPLLTKSESMPVISVAKRFIADKKPSHRNFRQSIYENSLNAQSDVLDGGSGDAIGGRSYGSGSMPTFSTSSVIVPDKKRYITSLAVNPLWAEAPYLAVGSGSGELFLYKDNRSTLGYESQSADLSLVHTRHLGASIHSLQWGNATLLGMSSGAQSARIYNVDVPHIEGGGEGLELVQELVSADSSRINRLGFVPQDQARTACGATNESILLWDVASAEIVADWQSPLGRICSMDISKSTPDLVIVGTADSHIVCFDGRIPDADQPSWHVSNAHDGPVRAVTFNPFVGWWLASGGDDGVINLWDTRYAKTTRKPILRLEGHANRVNSLVWSNTHISMIASGSADRSFRMWSLQDENVLPENAIPNLQKSKSLNTGVAQMTRSTSTMSNVSAVSGASGASSKMRGVWQLSKARSAVHRRKEMSGGGVQIGEWRSQVNLASDSAVIAMDLLPTRQNTFFATTSHGEVSCHALTSHALESLCPHRYPEGSKGYTAESAIFSRNLQHATELISDWLKQESEGKLAKSATAPIELVDTVVRGPLRIDGDDTPYDDIVDQRAGHAEALERFAFEMKETQWAIPAEIIGIFATPEARRGVELMTTYADIKHMARTNAWEDILLNVETIREGIQLSAEIFKPALLEACILSVFRHNHVAALQFTSEIIDIYPADHDLKPMSSVLHALNFPAVHDMYDEADQLSTEQILAVCGVRGANVKNFRLDDLQARVNIKFENAIGRLARKEVIDILLMEAHFSENRDMPATGYVKGLSQRSALHANEAYLQVSNVISFAKHFTYCQSIGATKILLNRMLRHVARHHLATMKSYFQTQLETRQGYFDPSISLQAADSVQMWQDKVIACCWIVQWLPQQDGYSEADHESAWDWDSIELMLATLLRKYIALIDNVPVEAAQAYTAHLAKDLEDQNPNGKPMPNMLGVILRKLSARYEQKQVHLPTLTSAQAIAAQERMRTRDEQASSDPHSVSKIAQRTSLRRDDQPPQLVSQFSQTSIQSVPDDGALISPAIITTGSRTWI